MIVVVGWRRAWMGVETGCGEYWVGRVLMTFGVGRRAGGRTEVRVRRMRSGSWGVEASSRVRVERGEMVGGGRYPGWQICSVVNLNEVA